MYPGLFPTPTAFTTGHEGSSSSKTSRPGDDRHRPREVRQTAHPLHHRRGRPVCRLAANLILNLDGLAKNLKDIGEGKVWIFCTAQQTLTEDDPRARSTRPSCTSSRTASRSRSTWSPATSARSATAACWANRPRASGAGRLVRQIRPGSAAQHQAAGRQVLRRRLRPRDFINLYPFLPAHFDILLHLLGALAKSTGGIGLRSAIKVIQDISEGRRRQRPWRSSRLARWPRPSRSTTRWRGTSGAPSPRSTRRSARR